MLSKCNYKNYTQFLLTYLLHQIKYHDADFFLQQPTVVISYVLKRVILVGT